MPRNVTHCEIVMSLADESMTAAVSSYLLAIERLTREQARATTKEVATFLGIRQSTVTEYLKRLAAKDLIDYEWRAGCTLTQLGETFVAAMLRRQRLLKTFMVQKLNYPLSDVYQESLTLQHLLSDRFTDALDELLDFPAFDPHGEVIPRNNGETQSLPHHRLSEVAEGATVQICYLPDWRGAELEYLCSLGLVPGACIHVLRVPPLNEPLLIKFQDIKFQGEAVALSSEIGHWVGVRYCDKRLPSED